MIRILTAVFLATAMVPYSAFAVLEDLPEVGADFDSGTGGGSYDSGNGYDSESDLGSGNNLGADNNVGSGGITSSDSSNSNYDSTLLITGITRSSQGQWYRVALAQGTELSRIEIQVTAAKLKIYEVMATNEYGQRIHLGTFERYGEFGAGSRISSLTTAGRIIAIDMRLESYGGSASAIVGVNAANGSYGPILTLQRLDAPGAAQGSKNNNQTPGGVVENMRLYNIFYVFATSDNGLNLPDYRARTLSTDWVRYQCESGSELQVLMERFDKALDRASNSWFRKRTRQEAAIKAAKKIAKYSRCGDLLKGL